MRIAVIGAGAIGSAIAVALAQASRDIVLVARGRRLKELQAGPLRIESCGVLNQYSVRVLDHIAVSSPVDVVICCVKTPDLQSALNGICFSDPASGIVLTLQNGVEAHIVAAQLLPKANIVAGRMHGFFELDEDGLVRHRGVPPSILLGGTQGDSNWAEQELLAMFANSTIHVEAVPDIHRALWEKFLLAASLGSVAAALAIPAGQVLACSEHALLLRAAMNEVLALAQVLGIDLRQADVEAAMAFVSTFPKDATTSLQRDLAAGRRSEFDALTAAVTRLGHAQRFDACTFRRLEAMISGVGETGNDFLSGLSVP